MPKVTFTTDFEYAIPGRRGFVAYRAGFSGLIPTAHFEAASKKGAAYVHAEPAKAIEKARGNSRKTPAGDQRSTGKEFE